MEPDVVKSWNDDWDRQQAKAEQARSRHQRRIAEIEEELKNSNFEGSFAILRAVTCVDVVDIQMPLTRDEMKKLSDIVFHKYMAGRSVAMTLAEELRSCALANAERQKKRAMMSLVEGYKGIKSWDDYFSLCGRIWMCVDLGYSNSKRALRWLTAASNKVQTALDAAGKGE
jgi:hypothetical protein